MGREIRGGLRLLDSQIVDCDGRMAGNVDDLEFAWPEEEGGLPYVVAILAGPGALARRIGGRLGALVEAIFERLHHAEDPRPARIPAGLIKRIGSHVELSVPKEDLDVTVFEKWVADHVINRIPGAKRAVE